MLHFFSAIQREERRSPARADPHRREAVRLLDVPKAGRPDGAPLRHTSGPTRARSRTLARCAPVLLLSANTTAHPRCPLIAHICGMFGASALTSTRIIRSENPAHAHTPAHTTRSNARDGRTTRERRRLIFSPIHTHNNPKLVRVRGRGSVGLRTAYIYSTSTAY